MNLSKKIYEAIQKGIQKSFNFEVDSDESDFKIKKSKLSSISVDSWVYGQYQEKYKKLIDNKDFQGCLDLYNSGDLNQKPRTIGYKINSKDHLKSIIYVFDGNWDNFDLNWLDVSRLTDMSWCFNNMPLFNCDISEWDMSNVTNTKYMFYECSNFNQNLNKWDVSKVENMRGMFSGCAKFNQPLNNWNVSNVENFALMFSCCSKFNQDISGWDVANAIDISYMFNNCFYFDQDLSKWDVSNVKIHGGTFFECPIAEHHMPHFKKQKR